MKRLGILILFVILFSSCRLYDRIFNGEVVARVGTHILYKEDIEKLNITGFSPEDSIRIVTQYIHSWAKDNLLLDMAQTQLPKNDKDVEKQLEGFRQQLLVFRYEKQYVEQRLDTLVSEQQYQEFYENNEKSFIVTTPLLKAIVIKIADNSPYLSQIKSLYRSAKEEDLAKLEQLCYSSAEYFHSYMDWVEMGVIAQKIDSDISACESLLGGKSYIDKTENGYNYLVSIMEMIPEGEIAPYEYSREKIKDIVINRRKQELVLSLERNLLNDAINSNKLIIY